MVRNTYIYPPLPSMRIIADIFAYCARKMPSSTAFSISGYTCRKPEHRRPELAYTLADGSNTCGTGVKAGI